MSEHCNNGGCTRPTYRGKECFRCWAGTKWTSIRQRVENKNGNNPSYEKVPLVVTKEELIQWVLTNPPPPEMDEPSIDRIIPTIGYALGNIRWLEKRINSRHCQRDIPLGFKCCIGCGEIKPLELPHWGRSGSSKWQGRCNPCRRQYDRTWRANRRLVAA